MSNYDRALIGIGRGLFVGVVREKDRVGWERAYHSNRDHRHAQTSYTLLEGVCGGALPPF